MVSLRVRISDRVNVATCKSRLDPGIVKKKKKEHYIT